MYKHLASLFPYAIFTLALLSFSCAAQQTEEQALNSLREMMSSGKLPPEAFVSDLESRFKDKKTGALAKLVHARIRFEAQDNAGAAAMLNSDIFAKRTSVADYAMWLRGKALQGAGDHAEAMKVFEKMLNEFPDSLRARDARLLWAASAITAGRAVEVPPMLMPLTTKFDADAFLATAKAFEAQGSQPEAIKYYRQAYFYGPGTQTAKDAEAKLISLGQPLTPTNADEQIARADRLAAIRNFADAANAFNTAASAFPQAMTPAIQLRRLTALAGANRMVDAQAAFNTIPETAKEREDAYRQMILGYARSRMWAQARSTADEMRAKFPAGRLVPKTMIDAGLAARDAKNRTDEGYFLNTAVAAFPNSVEVAQAQFEAAWFKHESGDLAASSRMLIDHLSRYADKDTTNRGKAGYWAARDSERSGKYDDACTLYDGVIYRYNANWYGYLASSRLAALKSQNKCNASAQLRPDVVKAAANLRSVTVAAETAGPSELSRAAKSDDLATIGLFDWAIDELNEAKKTAPASPKINIALARYYRWKGDNTSALVAMQKSYPDYAQMFPEEMSQEEWSFFYPLTNWADIKQWSQARGLDRYQVAGFIRQETVFSPRAKSGANAYGLMQLLLPTARVVARKYGSTIPASADDLYRPAYNIELGTAFLKDAFEKFGRIEYVAVAYNAGPGRVAPWRATLPAEIDEFVEAIPFKETKQYVQGIIRNSAQYRRLYDDSGNFKPNVGSHSIRAAIDSQPREQVLADNPEIRFDNEPSSE